jgi:hypothetical protein
LVVSVSKIKAVHKAQVRHIGEQLLWIDTAESPLRDAPRKTLLHGRQGRRVTLRA